MRAIILAAGRGLGLQQPGDQQLPKCLLQFGGRTLLQRHLQMLRALGVDQVVLAVAWIEIDLPDDVLRANREILPMLAAAGATP